MKLSLENKTLLKRINTPCHHEKVKIYKCTRKPKAAGT